jgi:hypothetical protein
MIFNFNGKSKIPWKKILVFLSILTLFGIITFSFIWTASDFNTALKKISSWTIRQNANNGILQFGIWNIIPIALIPFIITGFIVLIRKKIYTILTPIIIGIILWVIYGFTTYVFLIEYSRAVVITSLLLMIPASFGIDYIIKKIIFYYPKINTIKNKKIGVFIIFISFSVLFINYPKYNKWEKLKLIIRKDNTPKLNEMKPASPINRYLTKEDLTIFKDIQNKRFISKPWKGLVLGVATKNIPLESKASIIRNYILSYEKFMKSSCEKKDSLIKKYKIDYVYSSKINCPDFVEINKSKENLFLYRF